MWFFSAMDLTPEEMTQLHVDSYKVQAAMPRIKTSEAIAE